MTRRNFLPTAAAALGAGAAGAAGNPKRAVLELRRIQLRNTAENQRERTTNFLRDAALPAFQRAGAGPLGYFASSIGMETPYLLTVAQYPSLAAMEEVREKIGADAVYQKALQAYAAQPGLSYERIELSLLRCFPSAPVTEVPENDGKRPARIFELRTYESANLVTLRRKIQMFEEGEIAIFRRLGLHPVFFGETIVGTRMPNLTYMLTFDDLATREKAWKAFGGDPEWQKLRVKPGFADADIVSNISNAILTPLAFSPIR